MKLDRRSFLQASAVGAGMLPGIAGLVSRMAMGSTELVRGAGNLAGGYGSLKATKALNTGEELLALPDGFQYVAFGKTGDPLSDGNPTPAAHDGMAAFMVGSELRVIRNHEVRTRAETGKPIGSPEKSYDKKAAGGTVTLAINPETRLPEKSWVSLSGTIVNCAGGPTPWGSWITCEETVLGKAQGYEQEHGYNFEVKTSANGAVDAVPLKAMGRFVHEAIAVDPASGIIYQTEDRLAAGFFRFIPAVAGDLAKGGKLQMLRVKASPKLDTRKGMKAGEKMACDWVDINNVDPDPATKGLDAALYMEGHEKGGATFARLEGCWHGNGMIYMTATNGGDKNLGQVWQYDPAKSELALVFESGDRQVMDGPDNLCVTPQGALAVCEDGDANQFLRGVMPTGQVFDFARNIFNASELCGVCFSPDGKTMFFNLQNPGVTVAVWGDFQRGAF